MGSYLNPGGGMFKACLRSKIYVDKSGLIAKTNEVLGSEQRFVCVSRPRRFGKSMAANMLAAYYGRGEDSAELFSALRIHTDKSFREHLAHMLIHSVLHAQGWDHLTDEEAEAMEKVETEILSGLGFAAPYSDRARGH